MKKKDRSSAYWIIRLRREHPAIYAELRDGRSPSVRTARLRAGLIRLPTALDEVKRAWAKLSPSEIRQFADWHRSRRPSVTPTPAARKAIAGSDGLLTATVVAFLEKWKAENRLSAGRIMERMGFKRYDYRLSVAIQRKRRLPPDVLVKLERWLASSGF
jgi:hypothetical protein